jgi:YidC/Oxa1 family membrane protein insertase
MVENKNLIIAIALSIVIVLGFEFLVNKPRVDRERAMQAERAASQTATQTVPSPGTAPQPLPGTPSTAPTAPGTPAASAPATPAVDRAALVAQQPRVRIDTPAMQGSILLTGARIDDLRLKHYRETVDPTSPAITLLTPQGLPQSYFSEFGWVAPQGVAVPGPDTAWTADRETLTLSAPVTLSWDNGQGLRFERKIALDGEYMFSVTDRVVNSGSAPVQLFPYGLVARTGTPKTEGFYILHEGPLAVMEGTLREPSYSDLKEKKKIEYDTTGGWIGITDKYWLVTLVPDQKVPVKARFNHSLANGDDRYQADFLGPAMTVAPGATIETTNRVFAGAKELSLINHYEENLGITRFDRTIDFGWFYWFTKPIFLILDYFYKLLGNYGLAILLLTVLVKILFFPLANKSYKAMNKMKLLQPEMEKLRAKYGDDRQRMSQEMMALYKRVGANPLAGCLPVVIQIPVFFALYKVLFISIEMRHAPFYGWIRDLSAPDPTSIFNLFGLLPWGAPEVLLLGATVGAWPVIMGITMFLQQKMNPAPPDPIQARIFLAMPFIFTFILAPFASGLVIYWAWNNTLSVLQQWVILRRMKAHPAPAK